MDGTRAEEAVSPARRLCRGVVLIATLAGIVVLYVWVVSAGTMTRWPTYSPYYSYLADAFLHRQTHLLQSPPPELLALPDPYDPVANFPYRTGPGGLHDVLLYGGRYYLYWGPAPAVLLALVKQMTGWPLSNDAYLVFAFVAGGLLFSTLLLLELRRRYFPSLPWAVVVPGIVVAGLGTPTPFLLGRAAIYEAAICGGQCFLLGLLYWWLTALRPDRLRLLRFALGGVCGALALQSRWSLAPAVAFVMVVVLWRLVLHRGRQEPPSGPLAATGCGDKRLACPPFSWRSKFAAAALLAVPLVLGVLAAGWYNQVRFDSWTDFGFRDQLAGVHARGLVDAGLTPSVHYLIPNTRRYLLCPPRLQALFPFLTAPVGEDREGVPPGLHWPIAFIREPVAGLLLVSPFVLFAVVAVASLAFPRRRAEPASQETSRWVVFLLLGTLVLGIGPALAMLTSTMRYLEDGTPVLYLLAALGWWQVLSWLQRRSLSYALGGTLAGATALLGVLLGVTSYGQHFQTHNPRLLARLQAASLPPWRPVLLNAVTNGNGCEVVDGKSFFWMGKGATVLDLLVRRGGTVSLEATFVPGPSVPDTPDRALLVTTDAGEEQHLNLTTGPQVIRLHVRRGITRVVLTALDRPTLAKLPSGDERPLVLGVADLKVSWRR